MSELLALTTTMCGKCPAIKEYLHKHVMPDDVNITIMDEENPDFIVNCKHWGATQAPTVIMIEDGEEKWRAHDVDELKKKLDN